MNSRKYPLTVSANETEQNHNNSIQLKNKKTNNNITQPFDFQTFKITNANPISRKVFGKLFEGTSEDGVRTGRLPPVSDGASASGTTGEDGVRAGVVGSGAAERKVLERRRRNSING